VRCPSLKVKLREVVVVAGDAHGSPVVKYSDLKEAILSPTFLAQSAVDSVSSTANGSNIPRDRPPKI
jgi:hypothetical protein